MKRWAQFAFAASLAVVTVACATDDRKPADQSANTAAAPPASGAAVGTTGAASNGDRDFVQDQLAMGEAEIALGQIAQQKGTHPRVKAFGEMMVRDHQAAGIELKQFAAKANFTLNETAAKGHSDHSDTMEALNKLSGREFDREYIDRMVKEHEKMLDVVQNSSDKADNAELRQWAVKSVPTVRQHLEQAKTIQDALKNADTK